MSFGGFVCFANVTVGVCTLGSGVELVTFCEDTTLGSALLMSFVKLVSGGVEFVSNSSSFCSVSSCSIPSRFVRPFKVCVRSVIAFTIMSAGVTVGCVMYLCLNQTVS